MSNAFEESRKKIEELKLNTSKSSKSTNSDSINITEESSASSILGSSFNDIDYAAMLMNTSIKMATSGLIKDIKFSSPIVTRLRKIIEGDISGSTQKIVSELFIAFPDSNFDDVKQKLDFYKTLQDRSEINHYLNILNSKIKRDITLKALAQFNDDSNVDKFIVEIDRLTINIQPSIIPFTRLSNVTSKDIREAYSSEHMLHSSVNFLNARSHTKAVLKGWVIMVGAPPGRGKTQFLMNETYAHLKAGKKVGYVALGDSTEADFVTKLAGLHFGLPTESILENIEVFLKDETFSIIRSNIVITILTPGEITSTDTRRFVENSPEMEDIDVWVWDYDSNFKDLLDHDMFRAHDYIYNNAYALANQKGNPKLVYVASQVKTGFYGTEYIPLHAFAESNRKQAIVDVAITISSSRSEHENCGIFNIVKYRRGFVDNVPFKFTKNGKIVEITNQEYATLRAKISDKSMAEALGVGRYE